MEIIPSSILIACLVQSTQKAIRRQDQQSAKRKAQSAYPLLLLFALPLMSAS